MSYVLYYNPDSANIVPRMALEQLGVEYRAERVPGSRTDRDADFFALNPRGLLPVMTDEDASVTVFETGAVALYLADKHHALAPTTDDPAARGKFLTWLFFISNTLHADLVKNFYAERHATDAESARGVKVTATKRIASHLELLDRTIIDSDGDWLLASGLSICDFYLGACVRWVQLYPVGDPAVPTADIRALPALAALMERAQELPSVRTTFKKEGIDGPAFVGPVYPPD